MNAHYVITTIITIFSLQAADIPFANICDEHNLDTVKSLIATPEGLLMLNNPDREGRTLLNYATEKENTELVALLLDHIGIDPNIANHDGWTPCMIALRTGNKELTNLFIHNQKVNIHATAHNGETAVTIAALWNHDALPNLLDTCALLPYRD